MMARTNITKEHTTLGRCPWEEGERVKGVKSVLLNPCGKFSTSNMNKEVALHTTIKRD
jgi:hypothetical protein